MRAPPLTATAEEKPCLRGREWRLLQSWEDGGRELSWRALVQTGLHSRVCGRAQGRGHLLAGRDTSAHVADGVPLCASQRVRGARLDSQLIYSGLNLLRRSLADAREARAVLVPI